MVKLKSNGRYENIINYGGKIVSSCLFLLYGDIVQSLSNIVNMGFNVNFLSGSLYGSYIVPSSPVFIKGIYFPLFINKLPFNK
jgi:hypothetical protein